MSVQGVIVAVLVVLAAAYVFRSLAPRRWLWRLGIGRRAGADQAAGASGPGGAPCGCSDCPPPRKLRR